MRTIPRAAAVLLALLLLAAPALAQSYTIPDVCTLDVPTGWDYDDTSYLQDNTQDEIWLVDLYEKADDGVVVAVSMTKLDDDWADINLYAEGEAGLSRFRDEMADTYAGYNYRYLNTVYVGDQRIPFVLAHFTDDIGPVYTAETVSDGWVVYLYAYRVDGSGDLEDDAYNAFLSILHSFTPAR